MTKLYILLAAILCITTQSMAQQHTEEQKPTSKKSITGIKGGINFSTYSGDIQGNKMQLGANAGIYALYMESERIGIQPELQYSLQGSEIDNGGHMLMHYLVVPVLLKVYPEPGFSIQAGPYASFLLAGKYEYEAVDTKITNSNGQDFGFVYGLSLGNEEKLTLGIRHHVGLSSIYKSQKLRNQVIQVAVGFCINK